MDYLDFDIEIGLRAEPFEARRYPVRVLASPAGEAAAEVLFPLTEIEIARALDKLQIALLRAGGPLAPSSSEPPSLTRFGMRDARA